MMGSSSICDQQDVLFNSIWGPVQRSALGSRPRKDMNLLGGTEKVKIFSSVHLKFAVGLGIWQKKRQILEINDEQEIP